MIDVHAQGTGRVAGMLEQAARRSLNPEPAFQAITDRLIDAERRLFATHRGMDPLTAATRARKARDPRPHVRANATTPLVATGTLERFLTTKGPGAQPVRLTSSELVFGVPGGRHDLHYARYQAKRGRDPLVSRAVLDRWAGRELRTFLAGR